MLEGSQSKNKFDSSGSSRGKDKHKYFSMGQKSEEGGKGGGERPTYIGEIFARTALQGVQS